MSSMTTQLINASFQRWLENTVVVLGFSLAAHSVDSFSHTTSNLFLYIACINKQISKRMQLHENKNRS